MLTQNSSDGTHGLLVLTHHEGDVTQLGEMSQEPQVITQTRLVLGNHRSDHDYGSV